MKVNAAVLYEVGAPFVIEELDLEEPAAGEILVKMAAAGVCHSDWHLVTGDTQHPLPVVPGHEGAGIVQAVGKGVSELKHGDHVALNWAPNCGACFYCLRDRPSLCTTYVEALWAGTMLDGTTRFKFGGRPVYHFSGLGCFADAVVVPQQCCVSVDAQVPLEIVALVGCAVTTGIGAATNTVRVEPGSSVVVFGVGGVGMSVILGAELAGAGQIIAVDQAEAKGDLALAFGASDFLMADTDVVGEIRARTGGRGADYVFEAIGLPAVQEQCLAATRPGGTLVLVGISPMGSQTNLPGAILTRQEKTVTGSYYGTANTARDFPLYIDLYRRGRINLGQMVSQIYNLSEINQAYLDMLRGENIRGVIQFDQ